ncbi:MAG: hypothetical protein CL908_04285 [Deltaproteobacteria bacterium]|nr:hypothetical protein [Deltaproteobacteria bacterium]
MRVAIPVLGLGVTLLATVVLGQAALRVGIDASIGAMLVTGDPAYAAHDEFKEWFGSDEVLSVAIPFRNALSVESLELQKEVVEALESIAGVVQVTALISQDDVVGAGDLLKVRPLVPADFAESFQSQLTQDLLRRRILAHPVWPGWLVSEGLGAVAIQVRLDDSPEAELRRDQTIAEIEATLEPLVGGRGFYLAGHPFMKAEISRSIGNDLARLLPISFLVMTILLLSATRSVYIGLVTSVSVLISVLWMIGSMGWLGLGITALTNTAPTILIALSTACFLHLTAAFQASEAVSANVAARDALSRVWRPMWVASITTAVGYASLSISSVPIVSEFGQTLAVGMIGTAVIGTAFLPAMLALAPSSRRRVRLAEGFGLGWVLFACTRFVARRRVAILVSAVVLGVMLAVSATQIRVDSSGPQRFDENSRFRVASRFYRAQFSGDVLESIYLEGDVGDFLEPAVLRKLQRLQRASEELPQVDKAISVADHIARMFWVFRGEEGDPRRLPDSKEAVAQLLLLYESSGDLNDIYGYVSSDYSRVRIILTADVQSSSVSAQLRQDLSEVSKRFLPEFTGHHAVVSTEMLLSNAADVIAVEQVRSAALALVLVITLIGVSLRSVRAAGVMIFPNILPLIINLGVMSIFGVALSDATSIISATAIGIAVDSTVHLLVSVREAEKALASRRAAVLHALVTTGRPVVVTGGVVVLGFSLLLLSEFGSVAELGALTGLTMVYCLLADLLVLPSQLLLHTESSDADEGVFVNYDGRWVAARAAEGEDGHWDVKALADQREGEIDRGKIGQVNRLKW